MLKLYDNWRSTSSHRALKLGRILGGIPEAENMDARLPRTAHRTRRVAGRPACRRVMSMTNPNGSDPSGTLAI